MKKSNKVNFNILVSELCKIKKSFCIGSDFIKTDKMPYDGSGWRLPTAEGLYDPSLEKDACGVGFIVHIDGKKTHDVLVSAQELSRR